MLKLKNFILNRKNKFKFLGKNTFISNKTRLVCRDKISIGDNVWIGPNSTFYGFGGIEIGSGSILAHNVEIMTRNHNYDSSDLQSIPYDSRYIHKEVKIGNNVWVGSHVLIAPGATIGDGAIIGMGTVVASDIPNYSVAVGNPAKVIKQRNINKYEECVQKDLIYFKIKNKK